MTNTRGGEMFGLFGQSKKLKQAGMKTHWFMYVKDVTIPVDDPRNQNNMTEKYFWTFAGMAWFIATDPQARASVKADRFQYIVIDDKAAEKRLAQKAKG